MEMMAELVTNPYIMTILLTIGLIGIGIEMLHPGFGVPGVVGLGAFTLYFVGHYAAGSAGWGAPALFIAGVVLLILELFVPSFGLIGVIGFMMIVVAIVTAASSIWTGVVALTIGVVVTLFVLWLLVKIFGLKPSWNKLILQSEQKNEEGFTSAEDRQYLLGQIGITLSPLRPSGIAKFGEQRHDVVSEGNIIEANVQVKVIKVDGMRVVVRRVVEDQ